ncbi:hypothetical protein OUZ56_013502 [Daphnia magna]|uniref:Uncharacterized protein n=1 Tax=Daphnia magna TaxID=35525 RepID=A0ABQ9Z639_9CRUS|nr:hypothetical protein OUZ56_013502 [Daphnia magna]
MVHEVAEKCVGNGKQSIGKTATFFCNIPVQQIRNLDVFGPCDHGQWLEPDTNDYGICRPSPCEIWYAGGIAETTMMTFPVLTTESIGAVRRRLRVRFPKVPRYKISKSKVRVP